MPLLPQHEKLLHDSAISEAVANERGYRSVEKKEELATLGFGRTQRSVPAMLIPILDVTGGIGGYLSRPDQPRIVNGRARKYEMPFRSAMVIDVPPRAREHLGDPSRPLFITEGARKADAAVSAGLCCIDLIGVWCFRGTNQKGGKTVLTDFESIALNGRVVNVAYDSDVMVKPEVHGALARLKPFLESRGAEVFLIYLPSGEGGAKVGLDDYFAAGHSVDDLLALARRDLRPLDHDPHSAPEYEFSGGSLIWNKRAGNGVVPVPLTNFEAEIVADITEDDGAETKRVFEIEGAVRGRPLCFSVPAAQFPNLSWATENLGASAVVYPGMGTRDRARAAIQLLSGEIPERTVYAHTGWAKVDGGWLYLHGDGAIGAAGLVADVSVALAPELEPFRLPDPTGADLKAAIEASFLLLELAPPDVTFPLLGGVYRAPLGPCDTSNHLVGFTGAGKTELAALAQQHYGAGFHSRALPGSWTSTANALEGLLFQAKDAYVVVDDFAPQGTAFDVRKAHRDAERVFRAQGNKQGRGRMRADSSLRPPKIPRGVVGSTGEDVPRGQSVRARLLIADVGVGAVDFDKLTEAQELAAAGLPAMAMAGYLRYLAQDYDAIRRRVPGELAELRAVATQGAGHRRTPMVIAHFALGLRYLLDYAEAVGAISARERTALWQQAWRALGRAAALQEDHQAASDPVRNYRTAIVAALSSGGAHVSDVDGDPPPGMPSIWGWRKPPRGSDEDWRPHGDHIGWIDHRDPDSLYLDPKSAYAVAQRMSMAVGEPLTITEHTLRKRLNEKRLLASTGETRGFTIRKVVGQRRTEVLHFRTDTFRPRPPGTAGATGDDD